MGGMKPSATMLARARRMGVRAGVASRQSGIPEACKFDQATMPELYMAWSEGYVGAAYPTRIPKENR